MVLLLIKKSRYIGIAVKMLIANGLDCNGEVLYCHGVGYSSVFIGVALKTEY